MALKPVLKMKVDELFLRWLSDAEVQTSLRESLLQIARGEAVSFASQKQTGSSLVRGASPRMSSNSLTTPSSPKLPSPRSPRRPLSTKKQNSVEIIRPSISANHKDKETAHHHLSPANTTTTTTTTTSRGTPHPDGLQKPHPVGGGGGGTKTVSPAHSSSNDNDADGDNLVAPSSLPHGVDAVSDQQRQSKDKDSGAQHPHQQANHHHHQHHHRQQPKQIINSNNVSHKDPKQDPVEENTNRLRKKVGSTGQKGTSSIPQFYFPFGKPACAQGGQLESALQAVSKQFGSLEGGKAYKQQMGDITKACGLPLYWKILLFRAAGGTSDDHITFNSLSTVLKKLYQTCYDDASRFMRLVGNPGCSILEFDDFEPLIQDVVETHSGLTFLQDAPEFHSRYVTTVASRIMFSVNRSWSGRITLSELRKSNFLETLALLEEEEDINQVKDYFSYEHFYVIYCKFWELDKDHDLFIDKNDLSRHNDHALNSRLVERIFSGAVTRGPDFREGRMSYREFVWFLLAEEDKRHPTSVEYWFRCMDVDGDGVISMYEMEYFHEEQMNKMEALGIERLPFEDTVCQMMDLVGPRFQGQISLRDLKGCKMTNIFFDTFFNLDKFLEHEQRDPFANARDPNSDDVEISDWDRFAEEEYHILVADEGNGDLDEGNYEDDFEPEDEDEILREQMLRLTDSKPNQQKHVPGTSHTTDDIYDFSNTGGMGY